jgi:hypothetical protein
MDGAQRGLITSGGMHKTIPRGLKPASFFAFGGTAEQLAEKVRFLIRNPKNIPQGLKPRLLE